MIKPFCHVGILAFIWLGCIDWTSDLKIGSQGLTMPVLPLMAIEIGRVPAE
jgi:hypothetical protein